MEPVGLAVGVAGLAGLFSTCIDCFNLVQRGSNLGRDFPLCERKFSNQRWRLWAWGRACGLSDDNAFDETLWDDEVRVAVSETLGEIAALFKHHMTLSRRYRPSISKPGETKSVTPAAVSALFLRLRSTSLADLASPVRPAARRPAIRAAVRWAIGDKESFSGLVQDLKELIDGLMQLTEAYNIQTQLQSFIRREIESIYDVSELEAIEQARMGDRDPVAHAAGLQLYRLQLGGNSPTDRRGDVSGQSPDHDWVEIPQPGNSTCHPPEMYHQVLHRVSCDMHPSAVFLDEPSYDPGTDAEHQWLVVEPGRPRANATGLHLSGRRPLHHLDSYLEQNTQLWWLVFREYTCCHNTNSIRKIEPLNTSIRLVSPALCAELNSRILKTKPPSFAPGMELRPPYDWFYHNRDELTKGLLDHGGALDTSDTCTRPATESRSVSETLLQFIAQSMAEDYRLASQRATLENAVTWEHLPLIFRPGSLVIERCPDGDDDFRAFEQVDLPRIGGTSDPEPDEVLEIPVQRLAYEFFPFERRTLRIPRSLFESGQSLFSSLPVIPESLAKDCNDGYLYNRGAKCGKLGQLQLVIYKDPLLEDMDGEYIVDVDMYASMHQKPIPVSKPTRRTEAHQNRWYDEYDEDYDVDDRHHPDDVCDEGFDGDMYLEYLYDCQRLMCLPHAVQGFHLLEHVWHKLLVRNIRVVPPTAYGSDDQDIGKAAKAQLVELLEQLALQGARGYDGFGRTLTRTILTFHGPAWKAASLVVSRVTERPVYRIRLLDRTKTPTAVFHEAKALNKKWGCIILIEDVLEATCDWPAPQRHERIQPLLHFIESYAGIVVFVLPDDTTDRLDPLIARWVRMSFTFTPDGHDDVRVENSDKVGDLSEW